MGQGMGTGAGMRGAPPNAPYQGTPAAPQQPEAQIKSEQEMEMLKAQAQALQDQLRSINERLGALGRRGGGSDLIAVVDLERCTGCRRCEESCPNSAITVDDVAHIDPEKCDGCGQCLDECAQQALTLRRA